MGVLVYAVFKTFLKHVLEIHRDKELIEVIEYQNVFWSDFCQKWSDFGQILVRFSGKIGQIVSQILENFSQILIISTKEWNKCTLYPYMCRQLSMVTNF